MLDTHLLLLPCVPIAEINYPGLQCLSYNSATPTCDACARRSYAVVGCVLAGSKYSLSWSWAVLTSPGLALSILATIMSGLAIILTPFALHVPKEAPAADAGAKAEPAPAVTDSQAAPVSVADSEAAAAPEAATVTA